MKRQTGTKWDTIDLGVCQENSVARAPTISGLKHRTFPRHGSHERVCRRLAILGLRSQGHHACSLLLKDPIL